MTTSERYGESAERAQAIRRDLTNPELSLREIARRNGTSHSQVQRIRDEAEFEPDYPTVPGWEGPDLSEFEALEAERDHYERLYRRQLADNVALVNRLAGVSG